MTFPYLYRWDRHGRKGQPCRVTARSAIARAGARTLWPGEPATCRFNSILVEFADGFAMVTSGNAIRKLAQRMNG